MTYDEAKAVIDVLLTADYECPTCVRRILKEFGERFPERRGLCLSAWSAKFPERAKRYDDYPEWD